MVVLPTLSATEKEAGESGVEGHPLIYRPLKLKGSLYYNDHFSKASMQRNAHFKIITHFWYFDMKLILKDLAMIQYINIYIY